LPQRCRLLFGASRKVIGAVGDLIRSAVDTDGRARHFAPRPAELGHGAVEVASKRLEIGIERLAYLGREITVGELLQVSGKSVHRLGHGYRPRTIGFLAPPALTVRKDAVCLDFRIGRDLGQCCLPENLDRSSHAPIWSVRST
jgi:hypothetical protein